MSEDQIERRAESMMDAADRAFMAGRLTQDEYDGECHRINAWVEAQYRLGSTPQQERRT